MSYRSLVSAVIVAVPLLGIVPQTAHADFWGREHWHHHYGHPPHGWYGDPWLRGSWIQGWYGNRYGWWWVVGGQRYWYEQPVYPYPLYESPVIIAQPPVVIQQPSLPVPAPPVAQAQPNSWYYCDNPAGYYPYVQNCTVPFRAVPAQGQ